MNSSMKQNTPSANISMKSRPKNPVTTEARKLCKASISF